MAIAAPDAAALDHRARLRRPRRRGRPPARPGSSRVSCLDDEGDPLKATVTRAPAHGVAAAPARIPAPYGWDDITVAWTPRARVRRHRHVAACVSPTATASSSTSWSTSTATPPATRPRPPPPRCRSAAGRASGRRRRSRRSTRARRAGHARRRARAPDRRRPRVRSPRRRAPRARRARRQHRARGHLPAGLPPRRPRQGFPQGRPWPGRRPRPVTATPARAARLKLSRRAAGVLRSSGAVAFELSAPHARRPLRPRGRAPAPPLRP